MSATMSLPKTIDGLETIKTLLANFNIKDVVADQEEIRRQMQLTTEEQAKTAEAREYNAKYALLLATMEKREADLVAAKAAHEKKVVIFADHVKSEDGRLEDISIKIAARDARTADDIKELEKAKDSFAGLKLDHEREHRDLLASHQKQEAINTGAAEANAVEEKRLTEWAATLKRKAELTRQQLQQHLANF
jgi:hypothetical protein